MDTQNNPPQPQLNTPAPSNAKNMVFGIAAIIIIGAVMYGITRPGRNQIVAPSGETIQKREVNLSGEERKRLEDRVADARTELEGLPAGATAEARYQPSLRHASAYYGLGEYEQAIAALDTIIGENQDKARLWALYSNIYRDMGQLDKARENAKKALDLEQDNEAYWLAYINLSSKESNDTVKGLYEEALQKTESNIDVIQSYAKFLEQIGDKEGAITQWTKAGEMQSSKKAQFDEEINRLRR